MSSGRTADGRVRFESLFLVERGRCFLRFLSEVFFVVCCQPFEVLHSFFSPSEVGVTHQCVPWLVRHAIWLLNRFQRRHNGATAFENLNGVTYKKPLMQFGERCHWLEAERITHKYDPRWGIAICLGRHSASDAHLIGTPGGVTQVRTVRRLTREQRSDDVSKRAFDNFIRSHLTILLARIRQFYWFAAKSFRFEAILEERTAHGEKRTLTPGFKGCIWARRGYHHTKACKARKREFLLTKARSEELRAAEADAWRKPASATESSSSARPSGSALEEGAKPEPVDRQPQLQPDVGDSEMTAGTETPDAETTRKTRIVTKRSDPAVPTEGVLKMVRIWSKHSRPLTPAVVTEQPEKRARIPETPPSVNPETFAMMLESDGSSETCTELNAVALDLHEPDPETMWSSDMEWVPKSILQEDREKEVKKLQQFATYDEVPQAEAERQEIISSRRFVDKWEESGELRSHLVSRGYESSHADPAYTFGRTDENCGRVGIGKGRGNGSGGHFWSFSSCGVGNTFLCRATSWVPETRCCVEDKRDTCAVTSVRNGVGRITSRKRCWNWVSSVRSPNQVASTRTRSLWLCMWMIS